MYPVGTNVILNHPVKNLVNQPAVVVRIGMLGVANSAVCQTPDGHSYAFFGNMCDCITVA